MLSQHIPRQKVSTASKTEAWFIKNAKAAIAITRYSDGHDLRMSMSEKTLLYNLSNGYIDQEDIQQFAEFNSYETDVKNIEIFDYPLSKPRLDLLTGEAAKRKIPYVIRAVNIEAISEKEEFLRKTFKEGLLRLANPEKQEDPTKQEISEYIKRFHKWSKYEYQDARERMATQLLSHYERKLSLSEKFMLGFEDVTRVAEEIYCIEDVGGKPVVRKCDTRTVRVHGLGTSIYIDDADIVVEDNYFPVGQCIDKYYDYLTPYQIDQIEKGRDQGFGGGSLDSSGILKTEPSFPAYFYSEDGFISEGDDPNAGFWEGDLGAFDSAGNVHVVRVVFRGMRKIGELVFQDPASGVAQIKIVDETYEPNKELGEKVDWFWVSEWYEVTEIMNEIYVKMESRPISNLKEDGYKSNGSGYVGTIYTVGSTKAQSLLGYLKPYEYQYSLIMRELRRALKKYKAPMIEIDKSKIPEDFTLAEWLEYAEEMGYLVIDSFKEGTKGSSIGKVAGQYNTTGKIYNPDMGNYIQHLIMLLNFIEKQVSVISGVSDQRLGQIGSRETVGGVERSVTQSSNITEKYYKLHFNTVIRVLRVLLETAKYCHRNDKLKMQYVTDELANVIFDLDGEKLSEAEYGVFVSNMEEDLEILAKIKDYAAKIADSQQLNIKDAFIVFSSNSIAEIRRTLEESKDEQMQQAQQAQEMEQKQIEDALAQELQLRQQELAILEGNNIRDNETAIQVAYSTLALKDKELSGKVSIEQMKAALEERKVELQKQSLALTNKLELMKLSETARANKADEVIKKIQARRKPASK